MGPRSTKRPPSGSPSDAQRRPKKNKTPKKQTVHFDDEQQLADSEHDAEQTADPGPDPPEQNEGMQGFADGDDAAQEPQELTDAERYGQSYVDAELVPANIRRLPTAWPKTFQGRMLLVGVRDMPDNTDPFLLTSYILERCKNSTYNDVGMLIDSSPVSSSFTTIVQDRTNLYEVIHRLLNPVVKYNKGKRTYANVELSRQSHYSSMVSYLMIKQGRFPLYKLVRY